MVGSHKILTVSYGTFSCTLEGFDDPFGTMKGIAEYFRDLAADDRYFGAEPPTPDAEMLQRIAEKEIARRVDARLEASGVVLRAAAEPGPMPAPAPQAAGVPVAAMVGGAVAAAVVGAVAGAVARGAAGPERAADAAPAMPPAARLPGPAEEAATGADAVDTDPVDAELVEVGPAAVGLPVGPDEDGMAAKLRRIRAVVGRGAARGAETADNAAPEGDAGEDPGAALVEMLDGPGPDTAAAEPTTQAAEPEAPTPAFEAHVAAEVAAVPAVDAAVPLPARPRVIRMRRVEFDEAVAAGIVPDAGRAAPSPAGLSPEDEAELMAELAAVEAERAAAAVDLDPPEEPAAAEVVFEAVPEAKVEGAAGIEAAEAAEAHDADAADAVGALLASLGEREGAAVPDAIGADTGAATGAAGDEVAADLEVAAIVEAMAERNGDARADAAGPADASEPAAVEAEPLAAAAIVAHAEADMAASAGTQVEPAAEPVIGATADAEQAAARGMLHVSLDEAAMARIVAETDAQLADPEAARRRDAIAQLKAAVAATEAARRLGEAPRPTGEGAGRADPFRDDLARAVRPRRPVPPASPTDGRPDARPERPRPAPLKLVASQRVDLDATPRPVAAQAVRPRRVTVDGGRDEADGAREAGHGPARARGASFAGFAQEMGAHSLPEILEAAAAYLAFVEGAEDFSRPQVIDKMRQVMSDRFSREDGLRSFGMLLRQGTITRTAGGRFTVSGDSRFNPGRRAG